MPCSVSVGRRRGLAAAICLLAALGTTDAVTAASLTQPSPPPSPSPASASAPSTTPSPANASPAAPPGGFDTQHWGAFQWREVGPYRGGRADAVTGIPGDRSTYYFGATGGGVWKTTDAGRIWHSVSDGFFGGSIGDVAVSAWDPNVVYAGTGEETVRGNVSEGDGMWKSTDAGKTWKRAGLLDSRHITRIRIHPRNPDLVYAAVLGHLFGASAERGVYRSTDGGATWKRVLYVNDQVGAVDIAMDPANPRVLYASTWRILRTPYSLESGGPGSALWKSTDGGDTWKELTTNPGMPKGTKGIIGVSVSQADPENVYAIVEAQGGGLFRSRDGGATWKRTSDENEIKQRAWYYNRVYADPQDTESVYIVNVGFLHSKDGGRTFSPIRVPHGDNHDLWIDPADPRRMIECNDGGANVSENGGQTWTAEDNQPTAQIYRVAADNHFPYRLYGAQQDNSALRIASRGDGPGIDRRDWQETAGGESGYILPDPVETDGVYGGSYGGLLIHLNHTTGEGRDVNPWPDNPMGSGAADLQYRFQWNFPIALSPHDPHAVYVGSQVLFKSVDQGQSWTAISPDLTRNEKSRQGPSGGPITKDNTSVEYYDTIFTIAESPLRAGVLWVGSDDGLVHVSQDGGATWQDVTPATGGLPHWVQINSIEASPYEAGGAYFAATLYRADDQHPYLFKTSDYGRHWTRIDSGIDPTHFTRVVRADPARRGLLFAGTQRGVYVSFDDGARWRPLQLNLPIVPISDLLIKDGDLIAATEGRGFWILDDLEPLREWAGESAAGAVHLFIPRQTIRLSGAGNFGPPRPGSNMGQNPPAGVVIDYYLRDKPAPGAKPPTLEILDRDGKLIRRFTAAKAEVEAAPAAATASATPPPAAHTEGARQETQAKPGKPAEPAKASEAANAGAATAAAAAAPAAPSAESEDEPEAEETGRRARPEPHVPAAQGFNRFAWDLTYPAAKGFPGMVLWNSGLIAPMAAPGTYQARLTAAGQTVTVPFTVVKDPRSRSTDADLAAQTIFLLGIRDDLNRTHDALRRIRAVRAQIADLGKRLRAAGSPSSAAAPAHPAAPGAPGAPTPAADDEDDDGGAPAAGAAPSKAAMANGSSPTAASAPATTDPYAAVRQAGKDLDAKLAAVEEALYQDKSHAAEDMLNFPIRLDDKLNGVAQSAAIGDYRPTAQAIAVRDELVAAINAQLTRLDSLLGQDVPAFNKTAASAGAMPLIPPRPQLK